MGDKKRLARAGQEAMDRLSQAGAEIYRTDRQGNILVTVHGGD